MSVSAFQERVLSTHHRGAVMDRKNDWDRGAVILPCRPRKGGNFGEEERERIWLQPTFYYLSKPILAGTGEQPAIYISIK
jgi:hypothetical protein